MISCKIHIYIQRISPKHISATYRNRIFKSLYICIAEDGWPIAGKIKGVCELERFVRAADSEIVVLYKNAEVICKLKCVLVKAVINRERFMAGDNVTDAVFININ